MRLQRAIRLVDATVTQDRYIIWLACSHKVSVERRQLHVGMSIKSYTIGQIDLLKKADANEEIECPFCPDAPPADQQPRKSTRLLWREAGEP